MNDSINDQMDCYYQQLLLTLTTAEIFNGHIRINWSEEVHVSPQCPSDPHALWLFCPVCTSAGDKCKDPKCV